MSTNPNKSPQETHLQYLSTALSQARRSPPKPTNFRVGCVLVSNSANNEPQILSTGYTLELPGNTHAEQCALSKLASSHNIAESDLSTVLTPDLNVTLYTTLEPCSIRLSGNDPCVSRIIQTRKHASGGIRKVVFGAKEPGTFVQDSQSCKILTEAGVDWEYINGLEDEILQVAMEGHQKRTEKAGEIQEEEKPQGTNVDNISQEERARQIAQPRNPKKRMMEVDISSSSNTSQDIS